MTTASRTELLHKLLEASVALKTVKSLRPGAFYRLGVVKDIEDILAREPQEARIVAEHEVVRDEEKKDPHWGDSQWRVHCRCGWGSPWCNWHSTLAPCFKLHVDLCAAAPEAERAS